MTEIGKISDTLISQPDFFWEGEALPNATNKSSVAFKLGKNQAGTQLEIKSVDAITVASGQTLTFEVVYDEDENGSYSDTVTLGTFTDEVIAANSTIAKYVPNMDISVWAKLKVTATENLSAKTINAYTTFIAH